MQETMTFGENQVNLLKDFEMIKRKKLKKKLKSLKPLFKDSLPMHQNQTKLPPEENNLII